MLTWPRLASETTKSCESSTKAIVAAAPLSGSAVPRRAAAVVSPAAALRRKDVVNVMAGENRSEEYVAKNPQVRAPLLSLLPTSSPPPACSCSVHRHSGVSRPLQLKRRCGRRGRCRRWSSKTAA